MILKQILNLFREKKGFSIAISIVSVIWETQIDMKILLLVDDTKPTPN